jgi:hypothetical protein
MSEISTLLVNGNLPDLTVPLKEHGIHYLPDLEKKYKDVSKASLYRIVKGERVRHKKVFAVRQTVEKMILNKKKEILQDLEMSAKLNAN